MNNIRLIHQIVNNNIKAIFIEYMNGVKLMKKPILASIVGLLLMMLSILVYAQDTQNIGLLVPSDDVQYFESVIASVQNAADEAGYELTVLGSSEDSEIEAVNMASLIEQDLDVILVYPVSVTDSSAAVIAANEAGIPVIMLGLAVAPMENEAGEMTEASANVIIMAEPASAGTSLAEFYCDETGGEGTLHILVGSDPDINYTSDDGEETSVAAARLDAMNAYFSEFCEDVIVVVQETDDASNDTALSYLESLFENDEEVNGVVAANANLVLSGAEAARAARQRGLVFGTFDVSDEVLGNIESGRVSVAIVPDAEELGSEAIASASAVLMGENSNVVFVAAISINSINFEDFRTCTDPNGCSTDDDD